MNMKILVTGYDGYIGSVLVPELQVAGHEVHGIDMLYYADGAASPGAIRPFGVQGDVRDLVPEETDGVDAVIHLAALSNDLIGELNPELTYAVNHRATIRIAELAKEAGVARFLQASTCSIYGIAEQEELATEEAPLHPLSAYAVSKVRVEQDLAKLADDGFSPVYLRNATAFGWSPRFRSDLVLNNLACLAYTTGEILILSDGTPWRPLVHVQDVVAAFMAALTAPRDVIHNQAFNVGLNSQNYQVSGLAEVVRDAFEGCELTYANGGRPDPRSYRVDFNKIARCMPEFQPAWDARRGAEELRAAFERTGLTREDFTGPKHVRLARLKALLQAGQLDADLRWAHRGTTPQAQGLEGGA
jgi:nucleoside-diphosphate-sugar epimerase